MTASGARRAACLVVLTASAASAQVGTLYPVDEPSQDPSFVTFRLRLAEAVAAQDTAFVYRHLDPHLQNGFGGEGGVAEFTEAWFADDSYGDLWPVLATILGGGGIYDDTSGELPLDGRISEGSFYAPYWSARFDGGAHDPFTHGVVVGEGVRVRARPSRSAPVVASLSFAIVRTTGVAPDADEPDTGGDDPWVEVELADGRTGYVAGTLLRNPIGYRAVFHKVGGMWVLTSLLAGD